MDKGGDGQKGKDDGQKLRYFFSIHGLSSLTEEIIPGNY